MKEQMRINCACVQCLIYTFINFLCVPAQVSPGWGAASKKPQAHNCEHVALRSVQGALDFFHGCPVFLGSEPLDGHLTAEAKHRRRTCHSPACRGIKAHTAN